MRHLGICSAVAAILVAGGLHAADPSPTDLQWLRDQCGDGALVYNNGSNIYLVELSDGSTTHISGNIPNGWSFEFSPDSSKLAWLSGTTARGRMRKGDTTVHDIISGVSTNAGIHWYSNTEVLVVKNSKWYRVHIGTGAMTEVPQLTSLGTGGTECDVKYSSNGVWCYVTGHTWRTSAGNSGDTGGECSCSFSPDCSGGISVTGLHHDHLHASMTRVISGAPTGTLSWAWDYSSPKGFDNHRWSSNSKDFVACQDEKYNYVVIMKVGSTYCTRMGNSGGGEMYGDFTVGNGSGDPWPDGGANNPPSVNLTAGPTSGDAPLSVSFDANSSDSDGDTLNHDWDWDGNGSYDQDSGTDPTVSHTFNSAGTFTVKVRVSDGTDSVTDTVTITVTTPSNQAPSVNLSASPTSGSAPLDVSFDAGSSDPEGDTLNHDWDWDGDGSYDQDSGTDSTVTHSFDTAGTYDVVVRVSDGANTVTDTVTITVTSGGGDTLTFDAEADTYIYVSNPDTNYGDSNELGLGGPSAERVIYIRFNLSGIGSDTVLSAKLQVVASNSSTDAEGGGTIRLYGPSDPQWDEMQPTWNSPLGGSDASGDLDTIGPINSGDTHEYQGLESVITADGRYTFVIRSQAADGCAFRSSEYGTAADRPKLILTLDGGGGSDTSPPSVNASHVVLKGTADDNGGAIGQIQVGGSNVNVDSGGWTSGDIAVGSSTDISVVAEDASGNTTSITVSVSQ